MKEFMYNQNSVVIALMFFIFMLISTEAGYRFGRKTNNNESYKSHVNAAQASLLGLLALLIAFTFSIAIQRFDSRSDAVVDEANSIGTTYLRTELLPKSVRGDIQQSIRDYVDLRVMAGATPLSHSVEQSALRLKATHIQTILWSQAMAAVDKDPRPVTTGLYVQALNELIDSYGKRIVSVDRHVPEAVLLLLSFVFIISGGVTGYAVGITNQRPSFISYVMVVLFVLLVFLIIDLDHPRQGLIKVNQQSLIDLRHSIANIQHTETR
ncbi:MAG: DUF4239 domain-containing protein [Methylotenera sp.]|nr:DUF4239 domain-containing protein [Methylotenera sp.]